MRVGYYEAVTGEPRAARRVWSPSLRRLGLRVLCSALVLLAVIDEGRLLERLLVRHMNADTAILWLFASDWSRLEVHEPTFYGQRYGVNFEAIPVALLHALGVPYTYALPSALFLLAWAAWLWLAASAYRRGLPIAALFALAAPSLLPLEHWVIVGVIGTGVGRLLAAVCAGLVLRGASSQRRVFWSMTCGGLALAFDTATALFVLPAMLWGGFTWIRVRRLWRPAALGLIAPALWVVFNAWFTYAHPDHDMHVTWAYTPELRPLLDNLHAPDRLLGPHALEVWRHGALIPFAFVSLLCLTLYARAWREATAVSCALAQLVFLASLDKSLDDAGNLWYPAARMTLNAPMSVWFLAVISLRACQPRARLGAVLERAALPLFALLLMASVSERALHWRDRVEAIERAGVASYFLELSNPDDEIALCDEAQRQAAAFGTHIVATPTAGTATYACPALYPHMLTAYTSYDRRAWVLEELANTSERRMILWGRGEALCRERRARKLFTTCTPVANDRAVALAWTQGSPLSMLRTLGFKVRPFGPGCHPKDPWTCEWWAARFGR